MVDGTNLLKVPLGVPKRKARLRPAVESAVQQVRDGSFFGMHSRGHCRKHRIIEKKSPGSVKSLGKSSGNPVKDGKCRETPVANTADTLSEYYTKVGWNVGLVAITDPPVIRRPRRGPRSYFRSMESPLPCNRRYSVRNKKALLT